jgi:DNA polymerase IV (DinB-like DNA polymerase)
MRIVAHLDMDAFFAAIEERNRPKLKGMPIVVGADPEGGKGRGVVSTANYKAREYGIRSAIPIGEAWEKSEAARKAGKPAAVFIGGSYGDYGKVSANIYEIVRKHVEQIERASIDEMYMDLSFAGSYEKAIEICDAIKEEIREQEKLTCSIGIGPNKLVAKIASDRKKPDGLVVVEEKEVQDFLDPLSVRVIPGIGPKAEVELQKLNIKAISDLRKVSLETLRAHFGKWGGEMWRKARGISDSPVEESHETKSVSKQETFHKDLLDPVELTGVLKKLAHDTFGALKEDGFSGFRTLTLAVRFKGFDTKTVRHTFKNTQSDAHTLEFEAIKLFLPFLDKRRNERARPIRLLGVRLEKLT